MTIVTIMKILFYLQWMVQCHKNLFIDSRCTIHFHRRIVYVRKPRQPTQGDIMFHSVGVIKTRTKNVHKKRSWK